MRKMIHQYFLWMVSILKLSTNDSLCSFQINVDDPLSNQYMENASTIRLPNCQFWSWVWFFWKLNGNMTIFYEEQKEQKFFRNFMDFMIVRQMFYTFVKNKEQIEFDGKFKTEQLLLLKSSYCFVPKRFQPIQPQGPESPKS